ncbi:S9 family peptidase [Membranihabitans marinus]|uniref:S9 family peptidase n=1 Tax=Membranihabitans marinus TaxID=1227546 RepID=UPI001F165269|nr:S9 family peptidase [Membranihabitans marinus]
MTDSSKLPGNPALVTSDSILHEIASQEQGDYTYSVEDFFKTPLQSGYTISPDGQYLAYLSPYQQRKNIFIKNISDNSIVQITFEEDRDISGYFWANNQRIIYLKDTGGDENFKLFGVNKDGKEPIDLTPYDKVTVQIIDDLEDHEDFIIIGMNKNNPQLFDPYRLNIHTGELVQLAENDPTAPIGSWMTDHEGLLRLAIRTENGTETVIMYRKTESDDFQDVIKTDFTEELEPAFFDFNEPHIVYALSNLGRDKKVMVKYDLEAGCEMGQPIFQHEDVDLGGIHYSRKRKVLTAVSYVSDKRYRHFFDAEMEALFQMLEEQLPGREISIVDSDKEEETFLIRTYTDRSLGSYYMYSKVDQRLQKMADVSPWLSEEEMSNMEAITYTSRDGLEINGYLTLPQNHVAGKTPFIVLPHGGPWVRDVWGYHPEVQLFASRGYGVLQMNYRGSTGYGKDFWRASFKEWGRKMQDDITDGVAWLIDENLADPKKVAIYGGSYGGYATLAGVTFTPDLYACAIDYVGVSNLFTFMTTIPPYWEPFLAMMYEMVGHPEKDEERMRGASPIFHVDKIKAPLLVIQGANDPRVNIDESDQIVSELRGIGVDVPYMVKYNEGHGFRNEENRFEVYKVMLGFLAKYLK